MSAECTRYGMRDCLYAVFLDLANSARQVKPWDADARERWLDAAVWLLCQVPDAPQRCSWAHSLAIAFNTSGAPIALVIGELWRRVEAKRCV